MKILIAGTGGVGGYFGGKLAHAGHSVSFLARGKHLEAIQQKGLEVKSYLGNFIVKNIQASNNPNQLQTPDLVLLCTKSWQLQEVVGQILPNCTKQTVFLPLQNGADNYEKLISMVPESQALAGLCKIISFIERPGVIAHPYFEPEIVFGEADNRKSARVEEIRQLFMQSGIKATVPEDIFQAIWLKFLYICTVSGLGALTRVPIGVLRKDVFLKQLLMDTAREILAVGQTKGVSLAEAHLQAVFAVIEQQGEDVTASMQRDVMDGKPSELEEFNGFICREGNKLNISTPVNLFIYHCLKPQEDIARKKQ